MNNEQYLRALNYKFKYNKHLCMIIHSNMTVYVANPPMVDFFSCEQDDSGLLQVRENLELFQTFKNNSEHILLHITSKTFIVSGLVNGKPKIYLSRMAPLHSPSGVVIAAEVHMYPMSMVMGAVSYFQSKYFFQTNDISVSLRGSIGGWDFTEKQEAYLFFIIRNYTESDMAEIFGVKRTSVRSCVDRIRHKMEAKLGCKVKGLDGIRTTSFAYGLHCIVPSGMLPAPLCIEIHYDLEDWYDVKMLRESVRII